MWYRIKQKANISESQACCEEKQETSVHAMTLSDFFIWLGINGEVFDQKNDCKAKHMHEIISYSSHWCLEEAWDMEYYIWDQAQAIK
jgi:hypothetical protein